MFRPKTLQTFILFLLSTQILGGVQVRFVAVENQIKELFYISLTGEYKELSYDAYDLSKALEIRAREGKISLFKKVITTGDIKYQVIAEAEVDSMDNILGVLYSKGNSWHLSFYDNSASSFPNSSIRLINLLPVSIFNRIGNKMVKVEPFGVEVTPIKHKKSRPIIGLISAFKKDNQLKSFFDRPVSIPANSRLTCISVMTRGALDVFTGGNRKDVNQKPKVDYFLLRDEAGY